MDPDSGLSSEPRLDFTFSCPVLLLPRLQRLFSPCRSGKQRPRPGAGREDVQCHAGPGGHRPGNKLLLQAAAAGGRCAEAVSNEVVLTRGGGNQNQVRTLTSCSSSPPLVSASRSAYRAGTGCSGRGAEWAPPSGATSWTSSTTRTRPWTTSWVCTRRRRATAGARPTSPSIPTSSTRWRSTTDRYGPAPGSLVSCRHVLPC